MLEHPEIGWIERTGYPSWIQEQDGFCEDASEVPHEGQVEWEGTGVNKPNKTKPTPIPCICGRGGAS